MNWIIKNFLRGLVIVVPIAVTIWVIWQAFVAADQLLPMPRRGLGVAILIAATILIGALASNIVGRKVVQLTDVIFTRAPLVRIVYAAIKDLLEAFAGEKRRFDRAVAVAMSDEVKMLGFVTVDDLASLGMPGEVGVYVPFSYTWDGCMMVVPRSRVTPLEADSASVMAMIVSGGVSRV